MSEQKITPCLWFDFKAEEAVAHYLSIFEQRPHRLDRRATATPARGRRAR